MRPKAAPAGLAMTLGFAFALAGCGGPGPERGEQAEEDQVTQGRPIADVLEAHSDSLMSVPGVVGTGLGKCGDQLCIVVFVAAKTPELSDRLPSELEGYRVDIRESGRFEARDQVMD